MGRRLLTLQHAMPLRAALGRSGGMPRITLPVGAWTRPRFLKSRGWQNVLRTAYQRHTGRHTPRPRSSPGGASGALRPILRSRPGGRNLNWLSYPGCHTWLSYPGCHTPVPEPPSLHHFKLQTDECSDKGADAFHTMPVLVRNISTYLRKSVVLSRIARAHARMRHP